MHLQVPTAPGRSRPHSLQRGRTAEEPHQSHLGHRRPAPHTDSQISLLCPPAAGTHWSATHLHILLSVAAAGLIRATHQECSLHLLHGLLPELLRRGDRAAVLEALLLRPRLEHQARGLRPEGHCRRWGLRCRRRRQPGVVENGRWVDVRLARRAAAVAARAGLDQVRQGRVAGLADLLGARHRWVSCWRLEWLRRPQGKAGLSCSHTVPFFSETAAPQGEAEERLCGVHVLESTLGDRCLCSPRLKDRAAGGAPGYWGHHH